MTGPYQRRHPCSHLLPQRRIACTDGARGWACKQTLIDCAAGVRYALYCRQGLAASTVLCATGWVWVCAVCQAWSRCYLYHRLARRLDPRKRSVRSSSSACHKSIHTLHLRIQQYQQSRPHGRPPSLLPSARSRPSVRYSGRAHTTLLCPPPQAHRALPAPLTRSGAVAPSGVREFAGCLGSAPHRLHRLCA